MTPAQLVKAGEEIYHTKGTCEICHRIGQKGTRAPDLGGVGARAAKAKPGMSAKAYLLESLVQPQAFVVEGYPPIMPAVDKPPIALNRSEVWALTAFLESAGRYGRRHVERLPADRWRRRGGGGTAVPPRSSSPATPSRARRCSGRRAACLACHKAGNIPGTPESAPTSRRSPRSRRRTTS